MGRYVFLMTALAAAIGADAKAQPGAARIRPVGDADAAVVADAACRSATVRSMVARLEASDVIVYVTMRPMRNRVIAGGLEFVAATATDRVLRVVLAFPLDRVSRIAMLGHELQHAVEVADAPEIRSRAQFEAHYQSHGIEGAAAGAHETDRARLAERRVRAELHAGPAENCGAAPREQPAALDDRPPVYSTR